MSKLGGAEDGFLAVPGPTHLFSHREAHLLGWRDPRRSQKNQEVNPGGGGERRHPGALADAPQPHALGIKRFEYGEGISGLRLVAPA
jgi:hypothetical protein